jgi:ribosome-binding protein aMBF1 (putative translation factor)
MTKVRSLGSNQERSRRRRAERSAAYRAEQARLAPYEALARMVIARRIRYGLTQQQLAVRMGTSVSAISRVESGAHRPSVETLERLARAFGERLMLGFEDREGRRDLTTFTSTGQTGSTER